MELKLATMRLPGSFRKSSVSISDRIRHPVSTGLADLSRQAHLMWPLPSMMLRETKQPPESLMNSVNFCVLTDVLLQSGGESWVAGCSPVLMMCGCPVSAVAAGVAFLLGDGLVHAFVLIRMRRRGGAGAFGALG